MLNITHYQRNANQDHSEVPFHTSQNGCDPKKVIFFKKKKISAFREPARRSNQSILKEINPEYSLEGLMLKLKLQYFGHLIQTADSLEKTLMLGKIEYKRRRGGRG